MNLLRGDIQAEIELGNSARFYPSDAAIAGWTHQAYLGQAKIVYD
jgi:DNA polymerase-3 subunit alpha